MTSITEATESEPVSQQVIAEVAATTGKDPLEMEPLYTRVDPDCLETIFSDDSQMATRECGQISFPMAGCQVVLEADGTITVTEHGDTAETAVQSGQASSASDAVESPD